MYAGKVHFNYENFTGDIIATIFLINTLISLFFFKILLVSKNIFTQRENDKYLYNTNIYGFEFSDV